MVKIRSYNDSFTADWAKELLETQEIPVMVKSEGHITAMGFNTFPSRTGGFDLYVPEERAQEAVETLDAYQGKE